MFHEGQQIGQYTLIRKLGKGGFGEVWLAETDGDFFAIKFPYKDQVDWKSITQEIGVWTLCGKHPNVMPLVGARNFNGQIAIISEYAPEGSLEDLLKAKGKLSLEEAVVMTTEILEGLQHLHESGVIHRDLKPANILLDGKTPRLTDFGISRIISADSLSETIAGTWAYMAPECFDGKRNIQTDIWAVGVILYRMLTGNLPFPQKEQTALIGSIIMQEPKPLADEIHKELQKIILTALDKNSVKRYQNALEMFEVLDKHYLDYLCPYNPSLKQLNFFDYSPPIFTKERVNPPPDEIIIEPVLIPYRKGDTWGFCDINKNIKISCEYDHLTPFVEGLARVKLNGKWGFINKFGEKVIPLKYSLVLPFSEGRAGFHVGEESSIARLSFPWGLLDKSGNEVLSPTTYYNFESFSENRACINKNLKSGFIDRDGIEVIPTHFDYVYSFKEGFACVGVAKKYGFINRSGEATTPLRYDVYTSSFSEGAAKVVLYGKHGFIGIQGQEIISAKYEWASDFREGLAPAELNGGRGYINKNGDFVIPPIYRVALEFKDGLAVIIRNYDTAYVINQNNEKIFSFDYSYWSGQRVNEGMLLINIGDKYGFLDKNGSTGISPKYDSAENFRDGISRITSNGKAGYIGKDGTEYFED